MEREIDYLRRITNKKIKDFDYWVENNNMYLFPIELKEKSEEVNVYINLLLQYELLTDSIKSNKKKLKKIWKTQFSKNI
jgi:hypothetical protein